MNSRKHSCSWLVFVMMLGRTISFAAAAESWNVEWEKTLSAAKKEGEISFYGSQGYEKIFEVFQRRYPEIKVTSNTLRQGSEHGQAVMSERRAGKYIVDLFINGVVLLCVVFPLRAAVMGTVLSALLLLAAAFAFTGHAVLHTPPALVYPLITLICAAIWASATRDADIESRSTVVVDPLTRALNRNALEARVAELRHHARTAGTLARPAPRRELEALLPRAHR